MLLATVGCNQHAACIFVCLATSTREEQRGTYMDIKYSKMRGVVLQHQRSRMATRGIGYLYLPKRVVQRNIFILLAEETGGEKHQVLSFDVVL